MKTFTIQHFEVTLKDGSKYVVCCGPMVAHTKDVVAYKPFGEPRNGICCHKGYAAELCRKQTNELREYLGNPFLKRRRFDI